MPHPPPAVNRRQPAWPPRCPHVRAALLADAVAASDGAVAYVAPDSVGKQGRPLAGVDSPIDVVDATTGDLVSRVQPQGTPLALALSPQKTFNDRFRFSDVSVLMHGYARAAGDHC